MCGFSDGEFFTFRPARELDGYLFLMVFKNGVNIFSFFLSVCRFFFFFLKGVALKILLGRKRRQGELTDC